MVHNSWAVGLMVDHVYLLRFLVSMCHGILRSTDGQASGILVLVDI